MKKVIQSILLVIVIFYFGKIGLSKFNFTSKKTEIVKANYLAKQKKKAKSALGNLSYRNEQLQNVYTGLVDPKDYYKALNQANQLKDQSNKTNGPLSLEWVSRGPDSQGGRTRTILVDKDDNKLVFTGGVSGGLWKSIDGAQNWERVESWEENNSAIMSISQTINGTLFVGTGEDNTPGGFTPGGQIFKSDIAGNGLYKSNDKGDSWTIVDETNENTFPTFAGEWAAINTLATHPTNTNLLAAGNKSGIRISSNAEGAQPTFANVSGVSGKCTDVQFTSDGLDAWAAVGGRLYKSSDLVNDFSAWSQNSPSFSSRAQLAISKVDANGDYIVYASFSGNTGCLVGVYKTEDKGLTWTQIIFPGGSDPFQSPLGSVCQGWYDHCIAVNPADKNKIYIGGITFYTWGTGSGGLKRADQLDSSGETATILDPNYIHADKHFIYFDKHDLSGNTMYITGDGGVNKCVNANDGFPDNMVYTQNNKNYITLQCYGIGSGKYGEVMAGAQDNGTQYVDYKGISPKAAKEVYGGDGQGGSEISNLDPNVLFVGYQDGLILRSLNNGESATPFRDDVIDPAGCDFQTCDELDIIAGETCDDLEGRAQDFIYSFFLMETHDRLVSKKNMFVYAKDEEILLPGGDIRLIKDTIYPGDVTDRIVNSDIPGLDLNGLDLTYILPEDSTLYPGDTFFFENKFDAKYFVKSNCTGKFFVCTNPLQEGTAPKFSALNIPNQSDIKRMDASSDGDMLVTVGYAVNQFGNYINGSDRVTIMKGWDSYVSGTNLGTISYISVPISGARLISGVSVDKNDKDHVLVSCAGYGGTSKVFESFNATSSNPTFTNTHNNLPEMPIYSCLIDKANPDRYILGTELGIWASDDGGDTWFEENTGMGGRFPVFRVRQHWMNNFDCDLISAGTLGAGMYTCTTLMDCANKNDLIWGRPDDATNISRINEDINNISIYPNPVADYANVTFFLNENTDVTLKIIDLTGKVVSQKQFSNLSSGDQKLKYDMSGLSSSTYFMVVSSDGVRFNNKLFIKK